uniref:Uncharacterized protein n=2 Tax=Equus TaxID=9789 RepID=A0A3Q2HI45_HORSE
VAAYWGQSGRSYILYSWVCSKAERDALLKTEFKANAEKTSGSSMKIVKVKKESSALTELERYVFTVETCGRVLWQIECDLASWKKNTCLVHTLTLPIN